MLRSIALCLCLFGATSVVLATEEAAPKQAKLLPVFSVVTFPNDVCDGGTRNGTCFTSEECSNKGGTDSDKTCANGFGVCCVFELGCGDSSSVNNTYIVQSSFTASSSLSKTPCKYQICPVDSNICRIRFDFTTHILASTPVGTATAVGVGAAATATLGGALGQCVQDQFSITSGNGGTPVICGTNTGYHMIVDASSDCHYVNFLIGTTSTTRQWDIFVTQFNCGEDDTNMGGPPGCLQYFTGSTGYVASYAFPQTSTAAILNTITHLANQKYTNCIRREATACAICFTPIGLANIIDNQGTYGVGLSTADGIVQAGAGTSCTGDYIQIPQSGTATAPEGSVGTANVNKFCGRIFGTQDSSSAHETICTRQAPFTISVNFDETETVNEAGNSMAAKNEATGNPGGILGFGLVYSQITTNC